MAQGIFNFECYLVFNQNFDWIVENTGFVDQLLEIFKNIEVTTKVDAPKKEAILSMMSESFLKDFNESTTPGRLWLLSQFCENKLKEFKLRHNL